MGWANCGEDSQGRPIGYNHDATCDHLGCHKKIHRGLEYACGEMHGAEDRNGGLACEGYFCYEHQWLCEDEITRCFQCRDKIEDDPPCDCPNCVDDNAEKPGD